MKLEVQNYQKIYKIGQKSTIWKGQPEKGANIQYCAKSTNGVIFVLSDSVPYFPLRSQDMCPHMLAPLHIKILQYKGKQQKYFLYYAGKATTIVASVWKFAVQYKLNKHTAKYNLNTTEYSKIICIDINTFQSRK